MGMKPKKIGKYRLYKQLGKGQFGIVYLARKDGTDELFAVKQMSRSKIESNEILSGLFNTEVSVMHNIKHENILHLHELMESSNSYYLVLDYCDSGDLEEHMKKTSKGGFTEENAVFYLKQIANGFQELRKNKIMHRDFKMANIFLKSDGTVVIGDFGFAKSGVEMTSTTLGTPLTMAPELLTSTGSTQYTSKADLWSIGIVMYHMLQGKYPFFGMTNPELVNDIKKKLVNIPYKKKISNLAKDLIKKLLVFDAKNRISWKGFFNHPIFDSKEAPKPGSAFGFSDGIRNALASYIKTNQKFNKNKKADFGENDSPFNPNQMNVQDKFQRGVVNEQDLDQNSVEEMRRIEICDEISKRWAFYW